MKKKMSTDDPGSTFLTKTKDQSKMPRKCCRYGNIYGPGNNRVKKRYLKTHLVHHLLIKVVNGAPSES